MRFRNNQMEFRSTIRFSRVADQFQCLANIDVIVGQWVHDGSDHGRGGGAARYPHVSCSPNRGRDAGCARPHQRDQNTLNVD